MPAFVNGFLLAKDLPTDEDKSKFERLLGASPDPAVRNVTVVEQQQLACVKMSTDLVRTGRQTAYTKQYGPFDAGVDVSLLRPSHGLVGAIAQRRPTLGLYVEDGVVREMISWLEAHNPIVRCFYTMYELAKDVRALLPAMPGLVGEGPSAGGRKAMRWKSPASFSRCSFLWGGRTRRGPTTTR